MNSAHSPSIARPLAPVGRIEAHPVSPYDDATGVLNMAIERLFNEVDGLERELGQAVVPAGPPSETDLRDRGMSSVAQAAPLVELARSHAERVNAVAVRLAGLRSRLCF